MPTLMLIDGNSLTYRAFHALPQDLATASGQVTNAVFGFTSMLINLVRDHQPDGVAVAFDRPEPTFRHEQVETYKANRSAAPDILKQQMGLVRKVLDALRLRQLELAGVEADDILATLATQAGVEGIDVLLVTGDRDSFQLVSDPHIKVVYNKRGVSDYAVYDEAGILERTGVPPSKYVMYAAMRGDNSDNLPGVPGVGEKTAAKLLDKYGDLDGIFAHVEEQTPKLKENLAAAEELVRLNAVVMELLRDVDLGVDPRDLLGIDPYDDDEVRKLFDFLEFRTLMARLEEAFASSVGAAKLASKSALITAISSPRGAEAAAVLGKLASGSDPVSVAGLLSEDAHRWDVAGLAVAVAPESGAPVPVVWLDGETLTDPDVLPVLGHLLGPDGPGVQAHDAKPLIRALLQHDCGFGGLRLDTSLAAYLLDPA
ncbi:MAG: DNA polymerase I, partial [Acidimicrobiia bacterium]|nr:DNA polymerase I [Acidimicrobiia bacterium]